MYPEYGFYLCAINLGSHLKSNSSQTVCNCNEEADGGYSFLHFIILLFFCLLSWFVSSYIVHVLYVLWYIYIGHGMVYAFFHCSNGWAETMRPYASRCFFFSSFFSNYRWAANMVCLIWARTFMSVLFFFFFCLHRITVED